MISQSREAIQPISGTNRYDSLTDESDWSSSSTSSHSCSSSSSSESSDSSTEDEDSEREDTITQEAKLPGPKSIPENVFMVTEMLTEQLEQLNPDYCLQRLGCFSQIILAEDSRNSLSPKYKIDAHSLSLERAQQQRPGQESEQPMLIFVHKNEDDYEDYEEEDEEEIERSRRLCQVCGDDSSGFHYGVLSCEGCKLFFKRTLQRPVNYSCCANKRCLIDKESRKSCKFCRLQKCIKLGMKRRSVTIKDGRKIVRRG